MGMHAHAHRLTRLTEWTCSTGSLRAAVTQAQIPSWYGWRVDRDAPVSWLSSLKMAPSLSMAQLRPPITLTVCASFLSSHSKNSYNSSICCFPPYSLLNLFPQAGTLSPTCFTLTSRLGLDSHMSLVLLAMSPMSDRLQQSFGISSVNSMLYIHSTQSWTCILLERVMVSSVKQLTVNYY